MAEIQGENHLITGGSQGIFIPIGPVVKISTDKISGRNGALVLKILIQLCHVPFPCGDFCGDVILEGEVIIGVDFSGAVEIKGKISAVGIVKEPLRCNVLAIEMGSGVIPGAKGIRIEKGIFRYLLQNKDQDIVQYWTSNSGGLEGRLDSLLGSYGDILR
jgi:hypothetical protein